MPKTPQDARPFRENPNIEDRRDDPLNSHTAQLRLPLRAEVMRLLGWADHPDIEAPYMGPQYNAWMMADRMRVPTGPTPREWGPYSEDWEGIKGHAGNIAQSQIMAASPYYANQSFATLGRDYAYHPPLRPEEEFSRPEWIAAILQRLIGR